jgi:RimJ/RimL family protein N-acetyltransferase
MTPHRIVVEDEGMTPALPHVVLREARPGEERPQTPSVYDDWGPLPEPILAPDLARLLVEHDGAVVGEMSWHAAHYGPNAGSVAWNIGIGLVPEARGRGIGAAAQRALADHLFTTTDVDRIEAHTDVENQPEQRSLVKAGFSREGVLRSAQLRADGRHDLVSFSRLRDDA